MEEPGSSQEAAHENPYTTERSLQNSERARLGNEGQRESANAGKEDDTSADREKVLA